MSHVDLLEVEVLNLPALGRAGKGLGMELQKKNKYRWWGHHVGDHPIPEGFTKEDLGKCDYVLTVPGNKYMYEVGIVKKKEGPGYQLLWDFYAGGRGLQKTIGDKGCNLIQNYQAEVLTEEAMNQGLNVTRRKVGSSIFVEVEA